MFSFLFGAAKKVATDVQEKPIGTILSTTAAVGGLSAGSTAGGVIALNVAPSLIPLLIGNGLLSLVFTPFLTGLLVLGGSITIAGGAAYVTYNGTQHLITKSSETIAELYKNATSLKEENVEGIEISEFDFTSTTEEDWDIINKNLHEEVLDKSKILSIGYKKELQEDKFTNIDFKKDETSLIDTLPESSDSPKQNFTNIKFKSI